MNGAQALFKALTDAGIDTCFANPGTSEMHFVAALDRVLDMENPTSAIVFCRTRLEVETVVETLSAHGHRAQALHGGMTQYDRDKVMKRLRSGEAELLIATDVAARGLDIDRLTHVVNYDLPAAPEAYVHRIGRVGRAGREGVAITLVEPREHHALRAAGPEDAILVGHRQA